ncbi:MAG TPA: glycoside hydrolase family 3 C-terminal domain-containing protein, partial [Caulobacteraceae bacterium]
VLDGKAKPAGELRSRRHREIAARAAEESVVLLKNDGDLLPFDAGELSTVAVIGPNAAARRIQGGGSSHVRPGRRTSMLQAIEEFLTGRADVVYAEGGDNEPVPPAARAAMFSPDEARGAAGLLVEYFAERGFAAPPFKTQPEREIGKLVSTNSVQRMGNGLGALRWTGWFWPERDGRHEFSLRAPGEGRILIEGVAIIDATTTASHDNWDVGGALAPRRIAAIDLVAGRGYAVTIEYLRPEQTVGIAWEYVGVGVRQPTGSIAAAAEAAARCDAAIVVIGAASVSEGEGYDRGDLDLPGDQNALVEAVLAANPRTAIVLVGGAPYAMPWIDHAPAVLEAWLGGEEGPDAAARILFGATDPSGRLPVSFPRRLEATPAHAWYPGDETVVYGEGLFVGYRHFDRSAAQPMFPFGHGLTYTQFRYSNLVAPEEVRAGDDVRLTFTLANVGQRSGAETAQVYVRPRGPSVERPVKELKGFAKVALEPGEERRVELRLSARDFSFWDTERGAWFAEPGSYDLLIGCSAADIELQATVRLAS